MAEGTLWLHIGTHKTGSTSIQKALREKENPLNDRGIALYGESNAWELSHTFLRPSLMTPMRASGKAVVPKNVTDISKTRRHLRNMRGTYGDMIISAEAFCFMREALEGYAIKSIVTRGFSQVNIVVAFRNVTDWKASHNDQLEKYGLLEQQNALPEAQRTNGEWYYDHAAIRTFWSTIGDVTVLDYDAEVDKAGSILPGFAAAIEQPGLFDGLDLRLNQRRQD